MSFEALAEDERALLDFEREAWTLPGRKEDRIRERFAISPSSYYRALQAVVDRAAAYDYDPLTVLRLRRRRDALRRERIQGRRADPRTR